MSRYIENTGDFFASNYFDEDFHRKVQDKSGFDSDAIKEMDRQFARIKEPYYALKKAFQEDRLRIKDEILLTHQFHTRLLNALGYEGSRVEYNRMYHLSEEEVIPVRQTLYSGNRPRLMILEMQAQIKTGDNEPDGLFGQRYHITENGQLADEQQQREQRYHRSQWEPVFTVPEGQRLSPTVINKVLTTLFLQEEQLRPAYILLLAGNRVYLTEAEKWLRGSYLAFDLELLFDTAAAARAQHHFATFCLLTGKQSLAPDGKQMLLAQLDEDSHKSAYEVTKDLRLGIIHAIEALANEAIFCLQQQGDSKVDVNSPDFAQQVRDDCLTLIYRLLFVFYAESREELSILPVTDPVYQKGYSLEMLRDLEQVPLHSESARNGYFFHESLTRLFLLMNKGFGDQRPDEDEDPDKPRLDRSFRIRRIDSPLFDSDRLHVLNKVRIRNVVWQTIIQQLSLSREQRGQNRGRISYANLGINQLGSVYESLLSYRGFYTGEDYIEVHHPKNKEETFLVPRSRRDDFTDTEVLRDDKGDEVVIPKGRFVYRLSGRDRQKSASFYTNESLTRLTVKYALRHILERVEKQQEKAQSLLDLRLLEPAMGAAAFHNEMVNQLAEAYLQYRQKELNKRIAPDAYREELQKVKAWIAANNVYGVDLNPTAIELGKLSLWLNGIHRNMEPPFFANRLACGNAVLGAWLRVWQVRDLRYEKDRKNKVVKKEWWKQAPAPLKFGGKGPKRAQDEIYHFLLPDPGMLASAGIALLKEAHPAEVKAVRKWMKAMLEPYREAEIRQLQAICSSIDEELEACYTFLQRLRRKTASRYKIFGTDAQPELALYSYEQKEKFNEERLNHNAAYFKLKLVMDYWCALWFWDVREAAELPSRKQWLDELTRILQVKEKPASFSTQPKLFRSQGEQLNFDDMMQPPIVAEPEERYALSGTEALIRQVKPGGLFAERRLQIVKTLAEQHRFFHPQLEFLDVFRERGGFDLICGNPPWIKMQFDEKGVVSDVYPEVLIRKMSAPKVRRLSGKFLEDAALQERFVQEDMEMTGLTAFMNALQNYPLLEGQQTNLYKCILENGFSLTGAKGYMGLLHPEGVYDDPKGQKLRKALYPLLRYHFQFRNQLMLFAEIGHRVEYGVHVYAGNTQNTAFESIHNLFHPSTVDGSFAHNGLGLVGGIKNKIVDGENTSWSWNTDPHRDRIVRISEKELRILARAFEDSDDWAGAKLVSIHSRQIISVLEKLSAFPTKVKDFENRTTVCWDETNAVNAGIIRRETKWPDIEKYELIYSGPHFFVGNPLYKTPREVCTEKADYDEIDLTQIPDDFVPRTNYVPDENLEDYVSRVKGFPKTSNVKTKKVIEWDKWIDEYKVCFSKMLSIAGERTLQPAIIPPKVAHIDAAVTTLFTTRIELLEMLSLTTSLIMDFYLKSTGKSNLRGELINTFPIGISDRYKSELFSRTLMLNCLTTAYRELWEEQWQDGFAGQAWSSDDPRLPAFSRLSPHWQRGNALRTAYARRQALVEIDVLTAMALGLTLEELILIYEVQFPVLQQNEEDTWYDRNGNIVFTCSRGLTGVGTDRPTWDTIKGLKQGQTYTHTTDPAKNELYAGRETTYYAPFDKCDRVEDYKRAWGYFKGVLGGDLNHQME